MDCKLNPFTKFNNDWALVTAGNKDSFNSMTISWGMMGTIWHKDAITVYVRPERYTHKFLEENDYFTVSFFAEDHRDALVLMGRKSGRDIDKVKESGLTPKIIDEDKITYEEAIETYVCKKIYVQDLRKNDFPKDTFKFYGENGLAHTMFIGEVVEIIK